MYTKSLICFTINYICRYFGIHSVNYINFRTPFYVYRYINFSIHIFFNYLTYIEIKREIKSFCQTNYLRRFVFLHFHEH